MDRGRLPVAPLYADVQAYCSHVNIYCKEGTSVVPFSMTPSFLRHLVIAASVTSGSELERRAKKLFNSQVEPTQKKREGYNLVPRVFSLSKMAVAGQLLPPYWKARRPWGRGWEGNCKDFWKCYWGCTGQLLGNFYHLSIMSQATVPDFP